MDHEILQNRHPVPHRVGKSPAQSVVEFMDEEKNRRRHTPHGSSSSRTGTRTSSPNLVTSYPSPASRSRSYRAIGTLIAPIRRLDGILQDLLNYKLDAKSASLTAPKLARMLHEDAGEDKKQLNTVIFIHHLARNQAMRQGLVTCPQLIHELVRTLQTTASSELQTETALTLQLLAKTNSGALLLYDELSIPALVKMLRHPSEVIYTTALYILNQLMWHLPDSSRPEVRGCDGHLLLAELLRDDRLTDPDWLVICVDAIRMTVYKNNETKLALLDSNLHPDLIRLLRTYSNNSKVAYNIARLIKVLGTCNENKVRLVECGAVEALTPLLQSASGVLQLETLWGLRNLSDHAFHLTSTKSLLLLLIQLLASQDENVSICAAGCLCNLTCQNAHNKDLVVENGGVKLLCQLLNLNSQRQEISEPICSALRHVTHRSPHAQSAIYEIRQENTFPTIASILANSEGLSAFPLIKSIVGLVRNLATDEESRAQLRSCGVTRLLARALKQTYELIREHMNPLDSQDETEVDPTSMDLTDCIEGVRLDELLELCLAALQLMAKDNTAQTELVHTAGFLTIVVQLLYSQSQSLQRAAAAFLSQLSTSASGASAIEQEGACPRLTELIQSNNEYIAAYSAAVLHRITRDKPEQYRRRLSLELRQALFDGGLVIDAPPANDESSRVSGSVVHSRQHSRNSFTAAQRSRSDSLMDKSWVDLSGSRSRSRRSHYAISSMDQ